MAYNKSEKPDFPAKRKGGIRRRKKVCVFCGKDNLIDYKDVNKLKRYVSERGKILPRRITGTVQSIRERLRLRSREQDTWRLCRTQQNRNNFLGTADAVLFFSLSPERVNGIIFR